MLPFLRAYSADEAGYGAFRVLIRRKFRCRLPARFRILTNWLGWKSAIGNMYRAFCRWRWLGPPGVLMALAFVPLSLPRGRAGGFGVLFVWVEDPRSSPRNNSVCS